jgi:hypothetical protein
LHKKYKLIMIYIVVYWRLIASLDPLSFQSRQLKKRKTTACSKQQGILTGSGDLVGGGSLPLRRVDVDVDARVGGGVSTRELDEVRARGSLRARASDLELSALRVELRCVGLVQGEKLMLKGYEETMPGAK